ncbi:TonB-dependent receptor plug domain-containing protein [Rhodovulum euryhalinum]|uniref:Vitamin B12 transporter n=1 Tax=Rhodovulum euryhalinum TaxID=35805 RepID=A0A4R2KJD9_9RHOB|nr:TonB-dependent receptor [Rhodovulum euryhalinum]TCO74011.1 vitamin B12 transporter [Rhodovulum euryhalinum]
MIRKTIALGLGVTALTPLAATAQNSLLLDELVASASLLPIEVNRTGATVETLDYGEIARGGPNLSETFSRLPGLSFSANGGLGKSSTLRIRGLSDKYISTRIDGMDFSDPTQIDAKLNFGTLTAGLADRVEVLKGAQSSLYGANAIAGVVDITTWRPEAPGASGRAAVEVGSYGTYSGTFSIGQKTDRGEVAMTLTRLSTEGFSSQAGNTEDDGFEQTALTLSAAYDATDSLRLGFSALYSEGTSEYDGFVSLAAEEDETRKGVRAFAQIAGGAIDHELSIAYTETERTYRDGVITDYKGDRTTFAYLGSVEPAAQSALAFGAEWIEENADFSGGSYDGDSAALFGEWQYAPSDSLDLSFSLRYDDPSDFDAQMTGRVALAWRPQDDLIVRAVLGTGYRAPSLYQRFDPTYGNPAIQPEKSRSAEIGIEKRYGEGSFAKATLFYAEIEDLIGFDSATFVTEQVPGTTRSQGIELSGRYALGATAALFGNYTYTDAEGTGGRLIRVPRHDLNLGVEAAFAQKWTGQVTLQHVADQLDGGTSLGDYTVVNAGLSYAVSDRTEAYLRLENLFDEDYQTSRGFNTAGRSVYVGLRASF